MLAFLQTFLSYAALCVLILFTARKWNINSALTVLSVSCGSMLYFSICGLLGILAVAGWLYFAVAAAALVWLVLTRKRGSIAAVFTPGFCLFVAAGMVLLVVLAVRQPYLLEWDEFSLWAPAARLTAENDVLFTQVEFGWPWISSQKPGLMCMSYLFNFFGNFAPWRMYFAYDVLQIATWSALIAALPWKKWYFAVPCALFSFVLPYTLHFQRELAFCVEYMSSMGDAVMGVLLGGVFAYYYASRHAENKRGLLGVCTVLGAVAMCKDTGLPLALIAAVILAADLWLCEKECDIGKLHGAPAKGLATAAFLAVPPALFVACSRYLSSLGSVQGNVGGDSGLGNFQMILQGTKMLLGLTPSAQAAAFTEKFSTIKSNIISAFLHRGNTMLGTGFTTVLGIAVALFALLFLTKDKQQRRRVFFFGAISAAGFLAYFIFLGYTYVFVFKAGIATGLADYERYIGTYYLAWFTGVMALLLACALRESRLKNCLPVVLMLAGFVCLYRYESFIQPQLCIVDFPQVVYAENRSYETRSAAVRDVVGDDAKVFLVSTTVDGGEWFKYSYTLLPLQLDYSWGTGSMADPAACDDQDTGYLPVSLGQLAASLAESGTDYVLISESNDLFWQSYAALFADGGAAAQAQGTALYRLTVKDGFTVSEQAPQNREITRTSSTLAEVGTIRVMASPEQYITLEPVSVDWEAADEQ